MIRSICLISILVVLASATGFASETKNLSYGDHTAQRLDVFPVEGKHAPVMVYVHGGGWRKGDKRAVGRKATFFNQAGYVFVSVNYRLIPDGRHPANVEDIASALAWVHDSIAGFGGNPEEIYIMGHSAGCHLVSLVATDHRRLEKVGHKLSLIKGVIANDTQAYAIDELIARGLPTETYKAVFGVEPEKQRDASPYHHVEKDKAIPPFLILYSRGLGQRKNPLRGKVAEAFAEKLRSAGGKAKVADFSDYNHGQINQRLGDPEDRVTKTVMTFLSSKSSH